MANKVLNFSSSTGNNKKSKTETYRDINMVSAPELKNWVGSRQSYSIDKLVDVNAVKNAVHNIFTWNRGERILDPEFGTKIRQYLYDGISEQVSEQITAEIQNAIQKYEPRAKIDKLQRIVGKNEQDNNMIGVNIVWHVDGLPGNQYFEPILL